jgi:nucleotide-binding universal stress UspA family protein
MGPAPVATIIAGVDGCDGGWDALALALGLADLDGAALTIACAYPNVTVQHAPLVWRDTALEADATRILHAARDRCGAHRDPHTVALPGSTPGSALQRAATAGDLIVLGATRRAAVARALGDDVVAQTLDHAPCAVAVAPPGMRDRTLRVARIGVAADGAPPSRAAVHWASRIERQAGLRDAIESIDVCDHPGGRDDVVAALAAASAHLDVLVLAVHGRGPAAALLHGAVARTLARATQCPLIAVPVA